MSVGKTPRIDKVRDELHQRGFRLVADLAEGNLRHLTYSYNGWPLVLVVWPEDDGWDLYVPLCSQNSTDATWEALDRYIHQGPPDMLSAEG